MEFPYIFFYPQRTFTQFWDSCYYLSFETLFMNSIHQLLTTSLQCLKCKNISNAFMIAIVFQSFFRFKKSNQQGSMHGMPDKCFTYIEYQNIADYKSMQQEQSAPFPKGPFLN